MTLYLKYRPQALADLDLPEVGKTLSKIIGGKSWPHAWLFCGPRGTGKTSSARILAKAVNCQNRAGAEPCNKCEACVAIAGGMAPDVMEIDAASNRGIDEIRELRDKVRLAPLNLGYKVFVIDEVHMLTTEAANALLKTLEEPPEKTMFILCTTEAEKLPETVVSRCTRINFRKPTIEEAELSLNKVLEGEGLKANEGVIRAVAGAARGSFRDGTKLLEQIMLTAKGKTLSLEEAQMVLGMAKGCDPEEMAAALARGDRTRILELVDEADRLGINLRNWLERIAEVIGNKISLPPSQEISLERWATVAKHLDLAYEQMKTSALPKLRLALLAIELERKDNKKPEIVPENRVVDKKAEITETVIKTASGKGQLGLTELTDKWAEIMKAVKPKNHSVEALLRSTKPQNFDGEKLTLEVFYKFHKDKLESDKCRRIVEGAVEEIFGVKPVKLYLSLGKKQGGKEEISAEGVGEDIIKAAEEIFKVEAV